jgi:metal-dependent amidase/aminoacylase/carboxypeptidase family protein
MFYDPLSADDIEALSKQRRLPAAQIRKEAEALMRDMQRRYEKIVNHKEIAFNLHAEIHFAEVRLKGLRKNPQADPEQKDELREQIHRMEERRKRLLTNNLRPIRPTSRQLADFLGVSQDNATAINTLIHRARKILIAQSTDQGCHK